MSVQIGSVHPTLRRVLEADRVEARLRERAAPLIAAGQRRHDIARRFPRALAAFEAYCVSESAEDAARRLGVSPRTVENHVGTIMRALGAASSRQAAFLLWGPA